MTSNFPTITPHEELYGDIKRPNRWGLVGEAKGFFEPMRLVTRFPSLAWAPRGNGQRILTIPGLMTTDLSMKPMRDYLWYLGYKPEGWGLGRNYGRVEQTRDKVIQKIESVVEKEGGPIVVIGWSLGGIYARELSREYPHLFKHIFTLGTPVIGGPKFTTVAFYYELFGRDVDQLATEFDQRYAMPITRPVTAFYSKDDRIVSWEACIDRRSEGVEHIEVAATHTGMGASPDVLRPIADRLHTIFKAH